MAERQPTRGSFAFQPARAIETQRQGRQPQIGPMGNVGGGQSRSGVVRSENSSLSTNVGASLPGFIEKLVEPVMQEAQRERMFKGFAAAKAGQTMAEIADEQPALTAIFGQSDFEKGASLYYQRKAMNDLTTEVSRNMSQYAAMTPDAAYQTIWEQANSHRTGVRETDNALDAMMIEAVDELMPTITREQIKFRENDLTQRSIQAQVAAGRAYSQMLAAGQADPANADTAGIAQKGLDVMRGFEVAGITPESRAKVMEQTARGWIADNNFRAFDLIAEGGSSSRLFAMVGHDDATYQSILNQARTAKARYFGEATLTRPDIRNEYYAIRAQESARGFENAEDYNTALRDWATRSAAKLGISPADVLSWEEERNQTTGYADTLATQARSDAKDALDWERNPNNPANAERAAAEKQADILAGFSMGIDSAKHTDSERDDVMVSLLSSNPAAAAEAIKVRQRNGGAVLPDTARNIQERTFQQPELGPASRGFQTSLGVWNAMRGPENDRARIAYFGRDLDQAMRKYVRDVEGQVPAEAAYANNISRSSASPSYSQRTPSKEIMEAIDKEQPSWWQIGSTRLNAGSLALARTRVGQEAADVQAENPNWPTDRVVRVAEANLRTERLVDRVGSRMWDTPLRTPSMQAATGMNEDILARALDGVIGQIMQEDRFKRGGVKEDQVTIVYTGNSDPASAQWFVLAPNKDGQTVAAQITPATIRQYDERHLRGQRETAMRRRRVLPNASGAQQLREAGRAGSVYRR